MPGGSGFDLLARGPVDARIVFVTAHDMFAVRAFEENAVDYLLKPVLPERLARTLSRLRDPGPHNPVGTERILSLDDFVPLSAVHGTRFVRLREVALITAADDYTEVTLRSGATSLANTSMRAWEARLPASFARVHRSSIVNLDTVFTVDRDATDAIVLHLAQPSKTVLVSRRYAGPLLRKLTRTS
jgi:two-component system LytT family response regulator